jgi:M6 family metalloprotease-like protein
MMMVMMRLLVVLMTPNTTMAELKMGTTVNIQDFGTGGESQFRQYAGEVNKIFHADDDVDDEEPFSLREVDTVKRSRDIEDLTTATSIEADHTYNVLVVLVQWTNHLSLTLIEPSAIEEMWNGVGLGDNYKGGSISNWTAVNSHGKWKTHATVTDWIVADNTERYYAAGDSGIPGGNEPSFDLAVEYIMHQLDATGTINFGDFDQDNNGVLDSVMIIHSGYDGAEGGEDCNDPTATPEHRIHSLARYGSNINWVSSGTFLTLGNYATDSAFLGVCGSTINRIGVPIHELMHTVGLPDLYDLSGRYDPLSNFVSGMGAYDIM